MRISFPLLSMISTALLAVCILLGSDVSLYDFRASISIGEELEVGLHPTFLAWIDTQNLFHGMCYGNVMVCNSAVPETHRPRLVAHEARHLDHYQALGLFASLAQYILPLEPTHVDWLDPSIELAEMWSPPLWWPFRWSLLSISIESEPPDNPIQFDPNAGD